jgi:hypothetical protein
MRDIECNNETKTTRLEECHTTPEVRPENVHLNPEVKMAN